VTAPRGKLRLTIRPGGKGTCSDASLAAARPRREEYGDAASGEIEGLN